MQTQGVWQAGGHGKTPPDVHMGEAEVEALLDLEQYTGKVTTDRYSDSSWPFCLKSFLCLRNQGSSLWNDLISVIFLP